MTTKKMLVLLGTLIVAVVVITACAGPEGAQGPAGPAGPQGEPGPAAAVQDLTCTQCHNDTTLIWSKEAQFREKSVHGTGEAFERGETTACAGCHGTEGAKARINAGLLPHDASVEGITNVSPYDCRTCHNIHMTYTSEDWALTGGEKPVVLEKTGGTFDGGAGNLCANCHQIRNDPPKVDAGNVQITSSHYGTHVSAQASMLFGEGGLGGVTGTPSPHYSGVADTCVACHMGAEFSHTYEPDVARCQSCHADAENFDMNGTQSEVKAMVDELTAIFVEKGLLDEEGAWVASSSAPLTVTEDVADAMWNYNFVVEDNSMGVHNAAFTRALLQQALDVMKAQ
jgi:hypothetical protein